MPKAHPVPPLDTERTSAMLGPWAAPFALGYAMMRMGAEVTLFWADHLFDSSRGCDEEDSPLPMPETLEEREDTDLFA